MSHRTKNAVIEVYGAQLEDFAENTMDQISSVRYRPAFKYYDDDGKEFEYP